MPWEDSNNLAGSLLQQTRYFYRVLGKVQSHLNNTGFFLERLLSITLYPLVILHLLPSAACSRGSFPHTTTRSINNLAILCHCPKWHWPNLSELKSIALSLILLNSLFLLSSCAFYEKPSFNNTHSVTREAVLPNLGGLEPLVGHSSEIIDVFILNPASIGQPARGLSVAQSGEVGIWALESGAGNLLLRTESTVYIADVCQLNLLLATAEEQGIKIYDLSQQGVAFSLKHLDTRPASMVFSPDCKSLVIGGADGRLYRWLFAQPKSPSPEMVQMLFEKEQRDLETYFGHASVVSAVAYHPLGRVFFSADWQGRLSAWLGYDEDRFKGKYDKDRFRGNYFADKVIRQGGNVTEQAIVDHLGISYDGQLLLLATQKGSLELWSMRGFNRLAATEAHPGLIYDMSLSPTSNRAATLGRDGLLKIFELDAGKPGMGKVTGAIIEFVQEISLSSARKIVFVDDYRLLVGGMDGKLFEV
ncbi:MAG: WD40 repeat domain-containing protein, partial [Bdellovibrionales bacterium]|nr:WD40 repeat domain-containing protein [Bdellovibrionales bacterium]